jgi:hypothetical protein
MYNRPVAIVSSRRGYYDDYYDDYYGTRQVILNRTPRYVSNIARYSPQIMLKQNNKNTYNLNQNQSNQKKNTSIKPIVSVPTCQNQQNS